MSKRVLIVDDEEINRVALRGILASESTWVVTEANDGEHALDELCSDLLPQLCVVDLSMPRVDGLELLRRVRRDTRLRGLKVVITSSAQDRNTISELAKLGIAGYILKPFDAERTLAVLRPIMASMADPNEAPRVLRDLLTKCALVVDDDEIARMAVTAMIQAEAHWEVVEASSGASALEQLRAGLAPHVCFLDVQMPEMNGLELLSAIRSDPKLQKLRVTMTSGERDREIIRELAKLGIDAYLLKPLDVVKVRAALRAIS